MHNYSINSNKREQVAIWIFVIACILMVMIQRLMEFISGYIGQQQSILQTDTLLQMMISTACPIGGYEILKYLYVHFIWKWSLIYRWHKIPDFSGKWIGTVESPLKQGKHDITVTVQQNWDKIQIKTETSTSSASSSQAEIEVSESGEVVLHYAFDCNRQGNCYRGFNSLEYDFNNKKVEGAYFTNKKFDFHIDGVIREAPNLDMEEVIKNGIGSKGRIVVQRNP